jgi:predicted alpha/beta-hydrolase family hydrolase
MLRCMETSELSIAIEGHAAVSAILRVPAKATACYVMAHGAGAGMHHPFMVAIAEGLLARRVSTLLYQFPYMERGSKRVDAPALAHVAVRAAVAEAHRQAPKLPLFAGGKSFGGRMTSQAQAEEPLPGVQGLAFVGFPLHPAKKPSDSRADHLSGIGIPMLFLQGTRDALAEPPLMQGVLERLGEQATFVPVGDADHSFHVLKRSGRTDEAVLAGLLDALATWMGATAKATRTK